MHVVGLRERLLLGLDARKAHVQHGLHGLAPCNISHVCRQERMWSVVSVLGLFVFAQAHGPTFSSKAAMLLVRVGSWTSGMRAAPLASCKPCTRQGHNSAIQVAA